MLKYDPKTLNVSIEGVTDLESIKILLASRKELSVKIQNNNKSTIIYTPIKDLIQLNEQEVIIHRNKTISHYNIEKEEIITKFSEELQDVKYILQGKIWFLEPYEQELFEKTNRKIYNTITKQFLENDTIPNIVFQNIYEPTTESENYYILKSFYAKEYGNIYIWIDLFTNKPFQIYSEFHKRLFKVNEEKFQKIIAEITDEIERAIEQQELYIKSENPLALPLEIHNIDLALSRKNKKN